MKNGWIEFIFGRVVVKVSGKGIERFLNILTRNGLMVWNVRRHGSETITFKMRLRDALKIRKFARKSECRVSFLQRSGIPFLTKRLLKNSGFLTGIGVFFLIILLLSNVIWGIEIKGAKPATEHKIRKELDKMGVKIGKLQFFVDNLEAIQRKLTNNIGELTWVGVELNGTTYHFQVVEKNEPKKPQTLKPRNLVAKKKAIIVDMYVEDGQQVVNIHDHVEPGQLLVSGEIGMEGKTKQVAAKGEVWGETWYKSHVELPLTSKFNVFNGNVEKKHYVKLGKWHIPIWGFGKPSFKSYETETNVHQIHFLKWSLPIAVENKTVRERKEITRNYTKKEAVQIALDMAKKEIKKHIDEEAIIKDEKILQESFDNGKIILDIHFRVYENIAVGRPIPKEITE